MSTFISAAVGIRLIERIEKASVIIKNTLALPNETIDRYTVSIELQLVDTNFCKMDVIYHGQMIYELSGKDRDNVLAAINQRQMQISSDLLHRFMSK